MEQTVLVTLAGVQFSLEEGAFKRLRAYLDSLEDHFAHDGDRTEIIKDIEARIAEKLGGRHKQVIKESDIESIIKEIGSASDLDDSGGEEASTPDSEVPRRLYRDTDDMLIAGVASGIAAYFGIDPIIPRGIFLLSIFLGGTGVVIYLILWLIMPAAETASQKLEMRGHPVTLDTVRDIVKERIAETERHGSFRRLVGLPFEILRTLGRVIPILGKILGAFVLLGSFAAILGLTVAATLAITNYNAPYIDFPLRDAISPLLFFSTLVAGYLLSVIPLVLILLFGRRLMRRENSFPSAVGFGLIGLWSISLILFVALTVRIVGQYAVFAENDPRFASSEHVLPTGAFETIESNGVSFDLAEGDTYSVTIEGTDRQKSTVKALADGDTLSLSTVYIERTCIFCDTGHARVTVTAPDIAAIDIEGASVSLHDVELDTLAITAERARVDGSITATVFTIDGLRSSFELSGAVGMLEARLEDSDLDAPRLTIRDADITALKWSRALLDVTRDLESTADRESAIEYVSTPRSVTGPATSTIHTTN